MASFLASIGPSPESLPDQLGRLQIPLPALIEGIYNVKSQLEKEMNTLHNLMTAAGLPEALRSQTADILIQITNFRSGCLALCTQMIPIVDTTIIGLRHYDEDPALFDTSILELLNAHNLQLIKELLSQCRELLTNLIRYQSNLVLTKDQQTVATNKAKQVSTRMISLLSGLGVGIAATIRLRVMSNPVWPALAATTGTAFLCLGVTAWWTYKQTTTILKSGEEAVQEIITHIKDYDDLLHKCEKDLNLIQEKYDALSQVCKRNRPRLYKEEINKYCQELLLHLKLLQADSGRRPLQ